MRVVRLSKSNIVGIIVFFFNGWELGVGVCGGTCQIKTGCGS